MDNHFMNKEQTKEWFDKMKTLFLTDAYQFFADSLRYYSLSREFISNLGLNNEFMEFLKNKWLKKEEDDD